MEVVAPHCRTLAWKIPWMEELGRLQSMGSWRVGSDTTERLHFHFSLSCIGEGNGNPLQCSCLENPRDREAWRAAVYGVAQGRTQLRWLSSSSSMEVALTFIKAKGEFIWHLGEIFFLIILFTFQIVYVYLLCFFKTLKMLSIYSIKYANLQCRAQLFFT